MYEGGEVAASAGQREHSTQAFSDRTGAGMMTGGVQSDPTLQHPRCVFQILRRHYSRYTPEMVERVCGVPREQFLEVAETLIANSGRERTTMLAYARGLDPAHRGRADDPRRRDRPAAARERRAARAAAIMAMRGHASIQGSTDIPTLYELLPGYLPMPRAAEGDFTLADYVERRRLGPRLVVALRQVHRLAAEGLVRRRGHAGERLRLRPPAEDHRQPLALPDDDPRARRRARRDLRDGPEPGRRLASTRACSGARWRELKWLVVRDLAEIETASFWKDSPEVRSGEMRTEDIQTEVFLMPAAGHVEKEGHFTNTQRLLQWRDKALDPPGDARSELHFMHHLAKRVMAHYADSEDASATGRSATCTGTTPSTASTPSRTPRRCCARSAATRSTRASR